MWLNIYLISLLLDLRVLLDCSPPSVLIPLDKTGLGGGAKGEQDGGAAQAEDPYLVVHPNFVSDEGF